MALNIFLPGIDTVEDVLAIRARAIELIKEGGSTVGWTSEGTSVTKQYAMSAREMLLECNAYLQLVDSGSYGRRVTRTNPSFNY